MKRQIALVKTWVDFMSKYHVVFKCAGQWPFHRLTNDSPVLSIVGSEIIHVATLGEIHSVLRLPLFGHLDIDQVSGVLDNEFTFGYSPHRWNATALWTIIESCLNTFFCFNSYPSLLLRSPSNWKYGDLNMTKLIQIPWLICLRSLGTYTGVALHKFVYYELYFLYESFIN